MIYMKFKITYYRVRPKQSIIFVVLLWHIQRMNCLNLCKTASVKTDVYSFGITVYEIGNTRGNSTMVTSPWKNIPPVINDNLLINILRENKRLSLSSIREKYSSSRVNVVMSIITKYWSPNPSERPLLSEVWLFLMFRLMIYFLCVILWHDFSFSCIGQYSKNVFSHIMFD